MNRRTKNLGKNLETEQVGQLPLKDAILVTEATSLNEVIAVMRAKKSGCALVAQGTQVIGIFTERDLIARVITPQVNLDQTVSSVMTANPKTLASNSTIIEALQLMRTGGYRNIPVTETRDGARQVTKILSIRDVVKYFGSNFPEEVYNLPPEPGQTSQNREGA